MSLYILHSMMFKIRCETSMKGGGGNDEPLVFGLGEIDA